MFWTWNDLAVNTSATKQVDQTKPQVFTTTKAFGAVATMTNLLLPLSVANCALSTTINCQSLAAALQLLSLWVLRVRCVEGTAFTQALV